MPTPVREDGSPGPQKHLVVFVHGFKSSAACWKTLVGLLKDDPRFVAHELRCYNYPTAMLKVGVTTRLPSLKELGQGLGSFLDKLFGDEHGACYINITLVGHSMGGLVIQSWLVDQLQHGRGADVKQIRQIILIGTPNAGSRVVSPLRKLLYWFFPNPQERLLRVFDPEIHEITRLVQDKVLSVSERREYQCPIPMHAFWGEKDAIVEQVSAQGQFANSSPLPADHFGIIEPADAQSEVYTQIADAILFPEGHIKIFEVAEFRFIVKVEPRASDFRYQAEYGGKRRAVETDNVAYIRREARFSRKNRCREIFNIKYSTRNSGFIKYEVSHPNLAPADLLGMWEDNGTSAFFHFRPDPQKTYALNLEVYKGFDHGSSDVHHHINPNSYFRKYVFELDLSQYLVAGASFQVAPTLCCLPNDPGHSGLCSERNKLFVEPPVKDGQTTGIWRWELDHLREGIVDVRWEWKRPALQAMGVA